MCFSIIHSENEFLHFIIADSHWLIFCFAYDVADAIAEETPEKTAIVWCNAENEEHYFTFADVKTQSNRMANVFRSVGLKRGDRVMLVLTRHYEYWFAVIALHKLGITVIPATHMLTVGDYINGFPPR